MNPRPPDRTLVRRFLRRRDEMAFRALYRRHTPALHALVLRLVGFRDTEAQEIVQELWVRACRGLPRFRWRSSLRTWLCGIGINLVREHLRREDRGASEDPQALKAAAARPIDRMDLERAIASLPAGYRQVLVLRDIEGFTHREIGELLGIDPGTSKSQLHHARRAMRALLAGGEERHGHEH